MNMTPWMIIPCRVSKGRESISCSLDALDAAVWNWLQPINLAMGYLLHIHAGFYDTLSFVLTWQQLIHTPSLNLHLISC